MIKLLRKTSDALLHSSFPNGICAMAIGQAPVRHKHYNPKYKKERAAKVVKIVLPDFDEHRQERKLSIDEIRSKVKEKGIAPPRNWNEKPLFISCTSDIFERYVPPEGDGKISPVSSSGAKQIYDTIGKKGKSFMALRKIRSIDYEFDLPDVAEKVQKILIEAQEALTDFKNKEDRLHELATEKAFPEMMENVERKTIVWKFLQSLEPPRIVHIRCTEMVTKDNLFAQITVRFHTQQILAVYDRFGRLVNGSEDAVKDVLEYVVFEKHITHPNSKWRIHGKIIPDWAPPKEPISRTYFTPDLDKDFPKLPEPPKQLEEQRKEAEPVPALA